MQNGNAVFRGAVEAEAHVNEKLPAEVAEGFERGDGSKVHTYTTCWICYTNCDMWSPA